MKLPPADARKLVADFERQFSFLAEDLHDHLCQDLAGTALLATTIGRALERKRPLPEGQFLNLQNALAISVDHLRSTSSLISPADLSGTGLMIALDMLSRQLSDRVQTRFVCEKPVVLPSHSIALAFYRAAQHLCRVPPGLIPDHEIVLSLKEDQSSVVLEVSTPVDFNSERATLLEIYADAFGGEYKFQRSGKSAITTLRLPSRLPD